MIKIDRSVEPIPPILDAGGNGVTETGILQTKFDAGQTNFKFKKNIYNHTSVKTTLIKVQHGKCCFCESKFEHVASGDVEHFRPKGGYKQIQKQKIEKPGYYWLAYNYSNLMLACEKCNRTFKRNLFPLRNIQARATSHYDVLSFEDPLVIDPSQDDPSTLLTFEEEIIKPINNNLKAQTTIKVLGLNRKHLADNRLALLRVFKVLELTIINDPHGSAEAKALFKIMGKKDSEYSLMFKKHFPLLI